MKHNIIIAQQNKLVYNITVSIARVHGKREEERKENGETHHFDALFVMKKSDARVSLWRSNHPRKRL